MPALSGSERIAPAPKDIAGQQFGRLRAIRPLRPSSDGRVWLCRCECGEMAEVSLHKLNGGNTKSCGCGKAIAVRKRCSKDLAGRRFGRLIAIRAAGDDGHHHSLWLCRCDCGNLAKVAIGQLIQGKTRSCGCLHGETVAARNLTHGATHTREYVAFHSAKDRCERKNRTDYQNYGGRGIRFLFESFPQFLKELGPKPGPEYSLDRFPNNDGHYEPGNVRWATKKQQNNNTRLKPRESTVVPRVLRKSLAWRGRNGVRALILARDPLCQIGIFCKGMAPSTEVDHIIRAGLYIEMNGGDERFFFDPDNLRGACHADHALKTWLENRGQWDESSALKAARVFSSS